MANRALMSNLISRIHRALPALRQQARDTGDTSPLEKAKRKLKTLTDKALKMQRDMVSGAQNARGDEGVLRPDQRDVLGGGVSIPNLQARAPEAPRQRPPQGQPLGPSLTGLFPEQQGFGDDADTTPQMRAIAEQLLAQIEARPSGQRPGQSPLSGERDLTGAPPEGRQVPDLTESLTNLQTVQGQPSTRELPEDLRNLQIPVSPTPPVESDLKDIVTGTAEQDLEARLEAGRSLSAEGRARGAALGAFDKAERAGIAAIEEAAKKEEPAAPTLKDIKDDPSLPDTERRVLQDMENRIATLRQERPELLSAENIIVALLLGAPTALRLFSERSREHTARLGQLEESFVRATGRRQAAAQQDRAARLSERREERLEKEGRETIKIRKEANKIARERMEIEQAKSEAKGQPWTPSFKLAMSKVLAAETNASLRAQLAVLDDQIEATSQLYKMTDIEAKEFKAAIDGILKEKQKLLGKGTKTSDIFEAFEELGK